MPLRRPMMSWWSTRCEPCQVALAVHVDKSAKAHALKGEFESLLGKKKLLCKYTDGGKRPSAASVAAETISKAGTEHVFYICGPPAWMSEMQARRGGPSSSSASPPPPPPLLLPIAPA